MKTQIPSLRPSPTALLNPCADPIFKILFTDSSKEANGALTAFLSDILGKTVTDVTLQPNELSGESSTDRQSEFDINCKIDGKYVNIEMQGQSDLRDYGRRAEYHVAHLLNHYTPKGTDWAEIPQVYQISVLNFIFDKEEEDCISHYLLKNQHNRPVSQTINVIFLELPKIAHLNVDVSKLTRAQMWGTFFLYGSSPAKKELIHDLCKTNKGIEMAVTVLENVSQDEINWYHESRYWMHVSDEISAHNAAVREGRAQGLKEGREKGLKQGREQGLQQGLQQGREEGLEEGIKQGIEQGLEQATKATNLENARKMVSLNIDYDTIFTVTGVTKEMLETQ